MYLTKKEIENHKMQQNHTRNYIQKCYKTKSSFWDDTSNLSCHSKQFGQTENLAYIKRNDTFNTLIRQPFGLTAPYYSTERGMQKHSEPIQRKLDKNIIQFTQIVSSQDGVQQTKSIFTDASNVILGDNKVGEQCALFTRAALRNGHVMLILEWHDGNNTGNLVEHLIYKDGDEKASIERKTLATEAEESQIKENKLVCLNPGVFSLYRLATSSTIFKHKILTLQQKQQAIALLESEKGKLYTYALGAREETEPYDCVSWADKIWNQFQEL